jgi:hypothetical protein
MFRGRLVAQSTPADLCAAIGEKIVVGVRDIPRAAERLRAAGMDCLVDTALVVPVSARHAPDASEINRLLVSSGFEVFSLARQTPSLKDAFLLHTGALAA